MNEIDLQISKQYALGIRLRADVPFLMDMIESLKKIDPISYYYGSDELHLTLLGSIDPLTDESFLTNKIASIIGRYPIKFELSEVKHNAKSAMVLAKPVGFSLGRMRRELLDEIGLESEYYKSLPDSYLSISWINFVRFSDNPPENILDFFEAVKDQNFGVFDPCYATLFLTESLILRNAKVCAEYRL